MQQNPEIRPTSAAYLREYIKAHRRRRRAQLIEVLGGCYVRCGATEDLVFDHIDPATKCFAIGSSMSRAWDELVAEALKTQLLCPSCHCERASRTAPNQLTATTGTTAVDALYAGQPTPPRAPGCERSGLG